MPIVHFSDEERVLIRKTLEDVDLGLAKINNKFRQKLSHGSESNNLEYEDYEEILQEMCDKPRSVIRNLHNSSYPEKLCG